VDYQQGQRHGEHRVAEEGEPLDFPINLRLPHGAARVPSPVDLSSTDAQMVGLQAKTGRKDAEAEVNEAKAAGRVSP
jgi:hypothetical protein